MNTHTIGQSLPLCLLAGAAAALAPAVPASAQHTQQRRVIVQSRADGDHQESHAIAVTIDDGDIAVVLDGETIPQDRIRKQDGRIIILDEDGNELKELGLFIDDDDFEFDLGKFDFRFGDGFGGHFGDVNVFDGEAFRFMPVPMAADPPPVMLGVALSQPGPALAYHLGIDAAASTMIGGIYRDLPAHEAGLRQYDLIVEIDGDGQADPASIRAALQNLEDGDRLRLTVISEGQRKKVTVRVAAYDAEAMREAEFIGSHAGPGGPGSFRFWTTPGEGGKFKELFVAPDAGDVHRFMPDLEKLKDRVRKQLEDARGQRDHGEGAGERLDDLSDRMEGLEKMLDRLLDRIEKSRSESRK